VTRLAKTNTPSSKQNGAKYGAKTMTQSSSMTGLVAVAFTTHNQQQPFRGPTTPFQQQQRSKAMKEIATIIEEYKDGYLTNKDRQYIVDKMTGGESLTGAVICLIKKERTQRKRKGAK
jgi:hypothetical protein